MDTLLFGLSVAAVGMLIVFFGLFVLICILCILNLTVNKTPKKAAAPAPVAEAEITPAAAQSTQDDGELVAAITAAIAAVWQSEGNETGFQVRRVRRVSNASAWQKAGREEQIFGRM